LAMLLRKAWLMENLLRASRRVSMARVGDRPASWQRMRLAIYFKNALLTRSTNIGLSVTSMATP